MKIITFFFAIVLIPISISYSQQIDTLWTRTISAAPNGEVRSYEMIKYSSNEFIVTGAYNDSLYIVKINASGNILWEKYYYEAGGLFGAAIDKDAFGNFYVIVWNNNISNQWQLIKFNTSCDSLWSYTFSDPGNSFHIPYAITVNSNYVYVAASAGNGPERYVLHKFNLDGDSIFVRTYETGSSFSIPRSLTIDSQENIILAGTGGSGDSWYILKCNSNGDTLWSKSLSFGREARNVITDNDDNIIVTGWANKILKYSPNGELLFNQTLGGDDNWEGASLLKYDDENVFVIGARRRGAGSWAFDILLGKYSIDTGDSIWTYVYYYPEPEAGAYGWDGAVFFDSSLVVLNTAYTVISGTYYPIIYLMSFSLEDTPVSVETNTEEIPISFSLDQNYPNPFNPTTTISYSLPEANYVTIKIYNMLGQEVKTLLSEEVKAGRHNINWNGENNYGSKVSSGTYIYRITAGEYVQAKKMILLK